MTTTLAHEIGMKDRVSMSHGKSILEILGRSPIHPFPARMAPGIALAALSHHGKKLRVLDPMSGSGTVLAVAREQGHVAFGVDLDPLAVLLGKVWTKSIDPTRVRDKAAEVLARAVESRGGIPFRSAYPSRCDKATAAFLRYWFNPRARQQLTALARAIARVRDDSTRDALWCAFSRLIITKSAGASLAMDLSHSRPHRVFRRAPIEPFDKFLQAVDLVATNCPSAAARGRGPRVTVRRGDARNLEFRSGSIDIVLTSPPYLNAIDYMRCSKFALVWMGFRVNELGGIRSASIGAEASDAHASSDPAVRRTIRHLALKPSLSTRGEALLARYIWDMSRAIGEVARVLRPGGTAVYVVGDSTVRGTFISNSRIVSSAAVAKGLSLVSTQSRLLPANRRYLPPPRGSSRKARLDGRMRREVILVFSKPKRRKTREAPVAASSLRAV